MEFNEYQKKAGETAVYPKIDGKGFLYPAIGLAGETGEILEKIKKMFRDEGGELSDERRADIVKELGDVLWYVAMLAKELDEKLGDVAQKNIDKLQDRKKRDLVHGKGDN